MGAIYLRTNKINGMQYVGQTKNFKAREKNWNNLKWGYANQLLTDDRIKYGLDNFDVVIIHKCADEELDHWEKYYIEKLNTIYPNGYNDNEGGSIGFHHSQHAKDKMSEAHKGKPSWNKGLKGCFCEETLKKMSEAKKGTHHTDEWKKIMSEKNKGENNSFYGKHHSEGTKKKLSELKKGKEPWNKGKKMTEEQRQKNIENSKKRCKTVYQYTLNLELIKIWESLHECGRNGFSRSTILKCCKGLQKEHKGYIWSFIQLNPLFNLNEL